MLQQRRQVKRLLSVNVPSGADAASAVAVRKLMNWDPKKCLRERATFAAEEKMVVMRFVERNIRMAALSAHVDKANAERRMSAIGNTLA